VADEVGDFGNGDAGPPEARDEAVAEIVGGEVAAEDGEGEGGEAALEAPWGGTGKGGLEGGSQS